MREAQPEQPTPNADFLPQSYNEYHQSHFFVIAHPSFLAVENWKTSKTLSILLLLPTMSQILRGEVELTLYCATE